MPLLNIYALQDHLVPPSASKPLQQLVGHARLHTHEFHGGHIGIYVSGSAQREIPATHRQLAARTRCRESRPQDVATE